MEKRELQVFKKSKLAVLTGMVILAGACASTKPPTDQVARSQAAINQAEQVGARNYAPLEIREAKKKLNQARDLIERKKYEQAQRMADQAAVDAELAETKTLSEKAQKAVRELRESIKILKEEIARNQRQPL